MSYQGKEGSQQTERCHLPIKRKSGSLPTLLAPGSFIQCGGNETTSGLSRNPHSRAEPGAWPEAGPDRGCLVGITAFTELIVGPHHEVVGGFVVETVDRTYGFPAFPDRLGIVIRVPRLPIEGLIPVYIAGAGIPRQGYIQGYGTMCRYKGKKYHEAEIQP
jgi:hypothetical protein